MNTAAILILLKRFGPWIAVLLLIVGIWMHGRHTGAATWRGKYAAMAAERDIANDTAKHNADEVVKLLAAIERHNAAYALLERQSYEQAQRINAEHDAALRRQAAAYQRAIEDARESTEDLRLRLDEMSVAEACHGAWLEVVE